MEDIHVHAENRIYKVYGQGPASIAAKIYAHVRGIFTLWLLSIIPFVIVYINTFNVQYGVTVSFFIVLIELGKHLTFYDESPRAFLVLEYHPPSDDRAPHLPRSESENSVSESNEPSECAIDKGDEGEEETIETSCEGDVAPTEGEGAEGDVTPSEEETPATLESPQETNESTESTEKNETQAEPVEKED